MLRRFAAQLCLLVPAVGAIGVEGGCVQRRPASEQHVVSTFAPRVRVSGRGLVDASGHAFAMRGVGTGNGLLPDRLIWDLGPRGDRARRIEHLVEHVIGPRDAAKFWRAYRERFLTEADVAQMRALGFNTLRLDLNARMFLAENGSTRWIADGFEWLERVAEWSEKRGVYLIVSLQAAPGGQIGRDLDDSASDRPELFLDDRNVEATAELWKRIAVHLRSSPALIGYDLLDDPLPVRERDLWPKLEPAYRRMVAAIREVDPLRAVVLQGAGFGTDWSMFGRPFDPNVVYEFHSYAMPDASAVGPYVRFSQAYSVPILLGSLGVNPIGSSWYRAMTQLAHDNGIGWSFFPWKKLGNGDAVYTVPAPAGWSQLKHYSETGEEPGDPLRATMSALVDNVALERCSFNADVVNHLFRRVPARIEAENFGYRGAGLSYSVAHPSAVPSRYRPSDRVTIVEVSPEQRPLFVTSTEDGEWLRYDLAVERPGIYAVALRVASDIAGGAVLVDVDGQTVGGSTEIPRTGGAEEWRSVTVGTAAFPAGIHQLQIAFSRGGFNLDYIEVRAPGQVSAPVHAEASFDRPLPVPGRIEAEFYAPGGEGRAYHDAHPDNPGPFRREEGVDLALGDVRPAYAVELEAGDWLSYSIESPVSQRLALSAMVRTRDGAALMALLDGVPVGAAVNLARGWQRVTVGEAALSQGIHELRWQVNKGKATLDAFEVGSRPRQ